ncbi:TusE/DsrC/DsvC family sulfur relay protein [uncultured Porticoccus sp.]|uniref:TusE/DsrC/DsvC family sulfur relay protein n=1 Tax=uncultured Porticoccus sp. TaxID=1256050 RepID=UPI0030D7663A
MSETTTPDHLTKLPAWSESQARQEASKTEMPLTDARLEVILLARQFYSAYGFSPSMRPLIKFMAEHLEISKARSIYLMQLFPPSPAKQVAKLAGLPPPKSCL